MSAPDNIPLPWFVHTGLTSFEIWALSQPVPKMNLPALHAPSKLDLAYRYFELGLDLGEGTEEEIANTLIRLGVLDYLEDICRK